MARGKKQSPRAAAAGSKERRRRLRRRQHRDALDAAVGLVARPTVPKPISKHYTYFELVDNKDKKKKKLQLEITFNKYPPPGYDFVPVGNPELTAACKELSRDRGATVYIVSNSYSHISLSFANQLNRVGYHFLKSLLREASASLDRGPQPTSTVFSGDAEPIPTSQTKYHRQVLAALKDLFPRMPNTDRQLIIERAFTRHIFYHGDKPVGLCDEFPLSRRVQLAVLAHIRHTHTRYDQLLRETTRYIARKTIQSLCLEILVKWRGDEENGRDQLEEILREVIVISDSEDDDSDFKDADDASADEEDSSDDVIFVGARPVSHATRPQDSSSRRFSREKTSALPNGLTSARPEAPLQQANTQPRLSGRSGEREFIRNGAWQKVVRRSHVLGGLPSHVASDGLPADEIVDVSCCSGDAELLGLPRPPAPVLRSVNNNILHPHRRYTRPPMPATESRMSVPAHGRELNLVHRERCMSTDDLHRWPAAPGLNHILDAAAPSDALSLPPVSRPHLLSEPPDKPVSRTKHPPLQKGPPDRRIHHDTTHADGPSIARNFSSRPRTNEAIYPSAPRCQPAQYDAASASGRAEKATQVKPSPANGLARYVLHDGPTPSRRQGAQQLMLSASWAAGQPASVVMEDRGGFYETTAAASDNAPPPLRAGDMLGKTSALKKRRLRAGGSCPSSPFSPGPPS